MTRADCLNYANDSATKLRFAMICILSGRVGKQFDASVSIFLWRKVKAWKSIQQSSSRSCLKG